jgi:hypothetical protein
MDSAFAGTRRMNRMNRMNRIDKISDESFAAAREAP